MALVSAAVLAAYAHNTQPWLFEVDDARIDLFADRSRDIGAVDPFLREMYTGLGCALENLLLSARANGYQYGLALAPDRSDPAHAARIDLTPGGEEISPLYEAIPNRHTDRYAYDTSRPVPPETLDALGTLGEDDPEIGVFWFATRAERRKVSGLLVESTKATIADEPQVSGTEWILKKGQEEGEVRPFDTRVMALAIRAAIDHSATHFGSEPELDWRPYAREMASVFEHATRRTDTPKTQGNKEGE